MPIIKSHHAKDEWRPLLAWPDDCTVQWGGRGVVFSGKETYQTAFFEAFPADGSAGFLRGEGKTIEEAEADAFSQWERQAGCFRGRGHRWTRARRLGDVHARAAKHGRPLNRLSSGQLRDLMKAINTYTNSGCFCLRCGAFQCVARPIPEIGKWRDPLRSTELEAIGSGMVRREPWEDKVPEDERRRSQLFRRRLELRAKANGIVLPDHTAPEFQGTGNLFDEDPYDTACHEAALAYYVQQAKRFAAEPQPGSQIEGMMTWLSKSRWHSEAVRRGLLPGEVAEEADAR